MDLNYLLHHILTLILALYGDSSLPRKVVQIVIEHINYFICSIFLPALKNEILKHLEGENIRDETRDNIEKCFCNYSSIFTNVSTEHKRFELLRRKGFIDTEKFVIGNTFVQKLVGEKTLMVPQAMYGIRVPLPRTLKLFLEIPGLFGEILDYIKTLACESNIITNIIQADLWRRKYAPKFVSDIVFPLYIFSDDLEVGNVLGSHAGINKFMAVYAQISCLPPRLASQLSSILFSTLIYTEDKKRSYNKTIFEKLIEELNFLQTQGIVIIADGVLQRVKFQLILILGDNLGLNGILGFVESFTARYSCRICRVSSEKSATLTIEDAEKLRNSQNYNEDIEKSNTLESGIKEPCVFNEVNDFHVAENFSVDMMHDVLEGVSVYVLESILFIFIFVKKYFNLNYLNCRIQNFNYGPTEIANKPPVISFNRATNKLHLKMSASEILCLVRYWGLMIGDLIPDDDEYWQLYKYLRQIIDIVTSPRIIRSDAKILKVDSKSQPIILRSFWRVETQVSFFSALPSDSVEKWTFH